MKAGRIPLCGISLEGEQIIYEEKQFVEKDSLDRSFRSPFGTVAGTVMTGIQIASSGMVSQFLRSLRQMRIQ